MTSIFNKNQLTKLDDKYTSQDSKTPFNEDSKDEVIAVFNGGYSNYTGSFPVQTPYLSEVQFKPVSGDGFIWNLHPFKKISNTRFIVPMQQINSTLQDSAISPNFFIPKELYGQGVNYFSFKKQTTTYAYLKGSFNIYVKLSKLSPEKHRLAGNAPFKPPTCWLEMFTPDGLDPATRNQRIGLAMDTPIVNQPVDRVSQVFNGEVTPEDMENIIDTLEGTEYIGILGRRILANSIEEQLDYQEYDRTTKWIDAPSSSVIYLKTDGTSSIDRIQLKDYSGNIFYGRNLGSNNSSAENKIVRIPSGVSKFRINFSTKGDTARSIKVFEVPRELDNSNGSWVKYSLNIDSTVTFNPNKTYGFILNFYRGDSSLELDEHGFYITSGGFSCVTNVKDQLQDWVTNSEELSK